MEFLIGLLILGSLFLVGILILKGLLALFKVTFWVLTFPLKLVAGLISGLLCLALAVPVLLVFGVLGLAVMPILLAVILFPFILIGFCLYLLFN